MAAPAAATVTAGRTNRLLGCRRNPPPDGSAGAISEEPVIGPPVASRGPERLRRPRPCGHYPRAWDQACDFGRTGLLWHEYAVA